MQFLEIWDSSWILWRKHKIIKVLQNFCRGCRRSNPLLWYLIKKEDAKLTYLLEKTFFFLAKSKRSSNFLYLWRYMRLKFECLKQDSFLKTQCRERVNNDIFFKKMRLFMTFLKTDVISIKNMWLARFNNILVMQQYISPVTLTI